MYVTRFSVSFDEIAIVILVSSVRWDTSLYSVLPSVSGVNLRNSKGSKHGTLGRESLIMEAVDFVRLPYHSLESVC